MSKEPSTCGLTSKLRRLRTGTVQLSSKLHGSEIFYPDIEEEINVVRQFDKTLKYLTFKYNGYKMFIRCTSSVSQHCIPSHHAKYDRYHFNFDMSDLLSLPVSLSMSCLHYQSKISSKERHK